MLYSECASAYNSKMEWETAAMNERFDYCLNSNKMLFNFSVLGNIYLPTTITKARYTQPNRGGTLQEEILATIIGNIVFYKAAIWAIQNSLSTGEIGSLLISIPALLVKGILEAYLLLDSCMNMYVLKPHEVINREKEWENCQLINDTVVNTHPEAVTEKEVPFFYHCDPNWEPNLEMRLSETRPKEQHAAIELANDIADAVNPLPFSTAERDSYSFTTRAQNALKGKTMGYMGNNPDFCPAPYGTESFEREKISQYHEFMKRQVGTIHVEMFPIILRVIRAAFTAGDIRSFFGGGEDVGFLNHTPCAGGDWRVYKRIKPVEGFERIFIADVEGSPVNIADFVTTLRNTMKPFAWIPPITFWYLYLTAVSELWTYRVQGYYKVKDGQMKVCAAGHHYLMTLPIEYGCTTTAAPGEEKIINTVFDSFIQGTRCQYLQTGREDLKALGKALRASAGGSVGGAHKGVINFLESDFHFSSTIIGCLQDLLKDIFIDSTRTVTTGGKTFFQHIQDNLRSMVMAALVLHICLLGIKIITSPQLPKRSEFIMYAIKIGFVLHFALGSGWYERAPNGEQKGYYIAILQISEGLVEFFINAQNNNDYASLCKYEHNGRNILNNRSDINGNEFAGAIPTAGSTSVELTIWDLIDCKVASYMSFGSCSFTLKGMLLVWLVNIWTLFTSPLLFITSFIYLTMLFLIVLKFLHIFILTIIHYYNSCLYISYLYNIFAI